MTSDLLTPGLEDAPDRPLRSLVGVSKRFGGEQALDDVTLDIWPAEVHGLLGHNGSGKSTLIKILSGYHVPDGDDPRLVVPGTLDLRFPLTAAAIRGLGFGFVHQDLALVPSLTVLENLAVEQITAPGRLIHWRALERHAAELLEEFGLKVDLRTPVEQLSPWHRSLLAVVRAVDSMRTALAAAPDGRGVLVLDEPTARMSGDMVEQLLDTIRQVAQLGHGVLLVTHDLDEVLSVTDRVTVLRDGRVVGAHLTREVTRVDLVQLIVGQLGGLTRSASRTEPVEPAAETDAIRITDLSCGPVDELSLTLTPGTVVGLTGLVGSGFDVVGAALFGETRARRGVLEIEGRTVDLRTASPYAAMANKIGLVPPDRLTQGCIGEFDSVENLSMTVMRRFTRLGALRWGRIRSHVGSELERIRVVPPVIRKPLAEFSGGNQQKIMLAKWLQLSPKLLIAVEPTQGVDVGARVEILEDLRRYARAGNVVLCCTTDVDQLVEVCDVIGVMHRGRLGDVFRRPELSKSEVTAALFADGQAEEQQ